MSYTICDILQIGLMREAGEDVSYESETLA